MPVYNGEKHLRLALESLLAQSYSNLEIIVSDNASTDATNMIVQEFIGRDQRIRYYRQIKNLGPAANFDFTLEQASGEYFMWAASDDLWDKNWVITLLQDLSTKKVVLAFGQLVSIDEDSGQIIRKFNDFDFSGIRISRLAKYFMTDEYSGKACLIYGLFRTSFLRERKKLSDYTNLDLGADMHFVFDCVQYGYVSINKTVIFYKRMPETKENKANVLQRIMNSVLIIGQIKYFIKYIKVPIHLFDRLIIAILMPVKYIKTLFYKNIRNIKILLIR